MNTGQIQLRLTLSDQIYEYLQAKASRLGLPVTQAVKHLIIKDMEKEEYPTFRASKATEEAYKWAQDHPESFTKIDDIGTYMDSL